MASLCAVECVITEGGGGNRERSAGKHTGKTAGCLSVLLLRHTGQKLTLGICGADQSSSGKEKIAACANDRWDG